MGLEPTRKSNVCALDLNFHRKWGLWDWIYARKLKFFDFSNQVVKNIQLILLYQQFQPIEPGWHQSISSDAIFVSWFIKGIDYWSFYLLWNWKYVVVIYKSASNNNDLPSIGWFKDQKWKPQSVCFIVIIDSVKKTFESMLFSVNFKVQVFHDFVKIFVDSLENLNFNRSNFIKPWISPPSIPNFSSSA